MSTKTIIWILVAINVYLLSSQTTVPGTVDVDDPDTDNSDDVLSDAYSSTVGAIVAVASAQDVSDNGCSIIAGFEGCRLSAYYDVDSYSIGYGHKPASAGQTCTQDQADAWLSDDASAAATFVLSKANVPLGQNQLDALTSWVYNLGSGKVKNATLWTVLNGGDYDGVPAQLVRWCNVGGSPNASILARRQAEANLWSTPDGD